MLSRKKQQSKTIKIVRNEWLSNDQMQGIRDRKELIHTLFQGRPSSNSCVFLSLFLCFSCLSRESHSCQLNCAWENRNMSWPWTNSGVNREIQAGSMSCLLKQVFINSSFILHAENKTCLQVYNIFAKITECNSK